jgi:hypothetical protein
VYDIFRDLSYVICLLKAVCNRFLAVDCQLRMDLPTGLGRAPCPYAWACTREHFP